VSQSQAIGCLRYPRFQTIIEPFPGAARHPHSVFLVRGFFAIGAGSRRSAFAPNIPAPTSHRYLRDPKTVSIATKACAREWAMPLIQKKKIDTSSTTAATFQIVTTAMLDNPHTRMFL
jgi:hypothetical protein